MKNKLSKNDVFLELQYKLTMLKTYLKFNHVLEVSILLINQIEKYYEFLLNEEMSQTQSKCSVHLKLHFERELEISDFRVSSSLIYLKTLN